MVLFCFGVLFQRIDVEVIYFGELCAAVDKCLENFLTSCVYYFVRNTKGEFNIITLKLVQVSTV